MNQAQTDSLEVSKKLVVGVDVSKADFAAGTVWGEQYQYHGKSDNQVEGCQAFVERMEALKEQCGAEAIHLIIEPTGGYEAQLVSIAYRHDWRVTLVNPLTVRHWQQGQGKRGKADRRDTQMLTLFGVDKNPSTQRPTDEAAAQLDSLLRRKDDVQALLRAEQNRQQQAALYPTTPEAVHQSIQHTITALKQEEVALEEALRQLFAQQAELARQLKQLISVPAIGRKSAPYFLALFHRFKAKTNGTGTSKQLVAFVGLDPQPFESGSSIRQRPTISKQGDAACAAGSFSAPWVACLGAIV